jgi:hypothetical protein
MFKDANTAMLQSRDTESTEEIIGILTAISVVSKRMARRLALLERVPPDKEGIRRNERVPCNAD